MSIAIDKTKLCIGCKKPLSFNILGMDITNKVYFCIDANCPRCGLVTLVHQDAKDETIQGDTTRSLLVE
jgi:hypothetical protein